MKIIGLLIAGLLMHIIFGKWAWLVWGGLVIVLVAFIIFNTTLGFALSKAIKNVEENDSSPEKSERYPNVSDGKEENNYCLQCRGKLKNNNDFCSNCGRKV